MLPMRSRGCRERARRASLSPGTGCSCGIRDNTGFTAHAGRVGHCRDAPDGSASDARPGSGCHARIMRRRRLVQRPGHAQPVGLQRAVRIVCRRGQALLDAAVHDQAQRAVQQRRSAAPVARPAPRGEGLDDRPDGDGRRVDGRVRRRRLDQAVPARTGCPDQSRDARRPTADRDLQGSPVRRAGQLEHPAAVVRQAQGQDRAAHVAPADRRGGQAAHPRRGSGRRV